jgi:hypothetical protein
MYRLETNDNTRGLFRDRDVSGVAASQMAPLGSAAQRNLKSHFVLQGRALVSQ